MLKSARIFVLSLLALLLLATGVQAKTYVSLNGEFYINHPDEWEQVDFNTVDLFLTRSGVEQSMYDYDAVFAPSASTPFFSGDYLILTVEKVGELTDHGIDSVLEGFSETFKAGITYVPTDNLVADLKSNAPAFDRDNKILTVLNDIYQGQEIVKKNLVMLKFYDQGIATFYFYSPDSLFDDSKQVFEDIVASLGTEDLESMIPREEVKVADIETDAEGNLKSEKPLWWLYVIIGIIVLVAIIVYFRLRK